MKPALRSTIRRIAAALVLGFIANWAVTWSVGLIPHRFGPARYSFAQLSRSSSRFFVYDYRWFGVWERQYSFQRRVSLQQSNTLSPGAMLFWWTWEPSFTQQDQHRIWSQLQTRYTDVDQGQSTSMYSTMKSGWPALSASSSGAVNLSNFNPDGSFEKQIDNAVGVPILDAAKASPMSASVWFPFRPIWTGMLINTAFYAIVFWILLSIKRAYRHARRMHKGKCPICCYELGFVFIDGCPECGWRKKSTSTRSF